MLNSEEEKWFSTENKLFNSHMEWNRKRSKLKQAYILHHLYFRGWEMKEFLYKFLPLNLFRWEGYGR